MIRTVLLSAAASFLAIGWAAPGWADDDAKAAGDTSQAQAASDAVDAAPISPSHERPFCPPPRRESGFPGRAHSGQCFARVRTPPVYQSYSERILVTPARVEHRTVPAAYEWAERQVLVAPARVEHQVTPATYRSVSETEVVSPASVRVERIDPVYDSVAEQVVSRPAHTEWRRTYINPDGVLPAGARLEATGEVICLVEVPAEYRTVRRQVLKEPGRVIETPIPAVTRTVTRQVIDQPEQVSEKPIPAVYRTERYQRLIAPARVERIVIPAQYASRVRQRMISPGRLAWRPTTCVTDNPERV